MKIVFIRIVLILAVVCWTPALFAEEIVVTVKGMVCSFCAQGIKKTFGKNEKISVVDVDLDKKIVVIATPPEETISDEEIRQTISDAGYEVLSIAREKKT